MRRAIPERISRAGIPSGNVVISANLAFRTVIPEDSVPVLGIHHILAEDIAFFQ